MPINPTYPGVYVQEAPAATRTIVGVSTSVTAFIGYFRMGPMNKPQQIFNMGDFEREYGGLDGDSEASYAIQQYFLNGGEIAWVVRTAKQDPTHPLTAAQVTLLDRPEGAAVLQVSAANPGSWGNSVAIDIDYNTQPAGYFNLSATWFVQRGGQLEESNTMTFTKVSLNKDEPNYVVAVVNQAPNGFLLATDLLGGGSGAGAASAKAADAAGKAGDAAKAAESGEPPPSPTRPAQTGTTSGDLTAVTDPSKFAGHTMTAALNGQKLAPNVVLPAVPGNDKYMLAPVLQAALHKVKELTSAQVKWINGRLRIRLLDAAQANSIVTFTGQLATDLKLTGSDVAANVQTYVLGGATVGAQSGGVKGADGLPSGPDELVGSAYERTGIYALDSVDIFNLLSIPSMRGLTSGVDYLMAAAGSYCESRNAFFMADMSKDALTIQAAQAWMEQYNLPGPLASYASVYFPGLLIPDPLNEFRLKPVAPSGTLAGVYARTDANRGVWKAPAGVDCGLVGVTALEYRMTDDENGVINPLGVNALRSFPVYGNVSWGGRTMAGADARASEWKYIPVRRIALYIEESLRRGLQWVVFEPNGEVLWQQIRLNVGAFLQGLFVAGAFQGESPREAYFVNCDASTTSQNDIDRGIVNIVVGFAPLKPAEFVVLTIQQIAGQVQL